VKEIKKKVFFVKDDWKKKVETQRALKRRTKHYKKCDMVEEKINRKF